MRPAPQRTQCSQPGSTAARHTGHAFASFLLGAANSGSKQIFNTETGDRAGLMAFFAQDDWRATSKLTLNIGVRWEIPTPKTEAWNRQSGFDPTALNPLPSGATIPGAIVWLGSCSTCLHKSSFQDWNFKNLAPRFGVAYQITPKMVLRGGYGISYQPPIENNWGPTNFMGWSANVTRFRQGGQVNAAQPVLYLSNWKGGAAGVPISGAAASAPAGTLATPAPLGLQAFTGTLPNTDPAGQNGQAPDFMPAGALALPRVQNWSAGFQYELPKKVLLEANYVGSHGTRLINSFVGGYYDQPLGKYMAMGDLLGDVFQTDLSAGLLQPFGVTKLPYLTFEQDNYTDSVSAGLAPFPQYAGLTNDQATIGSSIYHSLQIEARKNSSHGLTFIAAYTISKDISDSDSVMPYNQYFGSLQDFYNRRLERSITSFDYPQVVKLTWIYSLPLGHGQRWLSSNKWTDRFVSGWQVTAVQRYGSGDPLDISDGNVSTNFTSGIRPDIVPGVKQTVPLKGLDAINGTPFLNPAAFRDPPSSPNNSWALRPGTAPRYLPNVRGPGHEEEDFGLIKDTHLNERVTIQLRADFSNVFNRTGRGDPSDTTLGDANFGLIMGPMNGPRVIQMGAHISF